MELKKKLSNVIVSIAKRGVRDDINSTGSPWMYQPKLPENAEKLKTKR